jgi:hypothetical protein
MSGYLTVVDYQWKLLVELIVMKYSWPTQGRTKIVVQAIRAPKHSFPALLLDQIYTTTKFSTTCSMQTNGNSKSSCDSEKTPTVIDSRFGQEIKALS